MIAGYAGASQLAVSFNPALRLPEAIVIAAIFVAAGTWLAWRGAGPVSPAFRALLTILRAAALGSLAVLWLNPGEWRQETDSTQREWLVLVDRSASMGAEEDAEQSRWQAAAAMAERLRSASDDAAVRVASFARTLEAEVERLPIDAAPDGQGTDLGRSVGAALDQRLTPLAGLVVLSDGRQTVPTDLERTALRARGRGIPIHAVPLGRGWGSRDLVVTAMPRQVLAFRDQEVKLSARVENRGLGNIRPTVIMEGPDGAELDRKTVTLEEGGAGIATFAIKPPERGALDYRFKVDPWAGEHLSSNNSDVARVTVLDSKIRVLLLEGAPYWDSKFLAQLLREQGAVEVLTVHRLNEDRYFRVEGTGAEPLFSPDAVFPASSTELARYDLIVFGKGAEGFLTPARVAALHGFVRDQGGALLFARGKPYSGRFPALESLEPVEWGEAAGGRFRFSPVTDAAAGLFGGALPPVDDPVWQTLPPLEDVRAIARLRPFARVLAEGTPEERGVTTPLLVARRFGRGMTATMNADGLWRWDFRPELRERGEVYRQFWVQLMQWCATYSEFRPGEDYAVRLRESAVAPGESVRALISWRGPASPAPRPFLKIYRNGEEVGEAEATALPGTEGEAEYVTIFTPRDPGRYAVRVGDRDRAGIEQGEALLRVDAPPAEMDDLRPDLPALETLARGSGGKVFNPSEIEDLVAAVSRDGADDEESLGKAEWVPLWPQWWVACLVCGMFGTEWWLRRREGLL